MRQHIRLAAILEREGRFFLVKGEQGLTWELPGGPLPERADDVDQEMDDMLGRIGVWAPAIEEDFLETHFFPVEDGQIVFNLYAASGWSGDPAAAEGAEDRAGDLHIIGERIAKIGGGLGYRGFLMAG